MKVSLRRLRCDRPIRYSSYCCIPLVIPISRPTSTEHEFFDYDIGVDAELVPKVVFGEVGEATAID